MTNNLKTTCAKCNARIDKTDVKTFTIVTIKDINKPKRICLCDSCTLDFKIFLHKD